VIPKINPIRLTGMTLNVVADGPKYFMSHAMQKGYNAKTTMVMIHFVRFVREYGLIYLMIDLYTVSSLKVIIFVFPVERPHCYRINIHALETNQGADAL
jgi:hypothetical protein